MRCKSSVSVLWLASMPVWARLTRGEAGSVKSARKIPFHKAPPDIAFTSCTYRTILGNPSLNTRGWTSNEACEDFNLSCSCPSEASECGATYMLLPRASNHPTTTKMEMTRRSEEHTSE